MVVQPTPPRVVVGNDKSPYPRLRGLF